MTVILIWVPSQPLKPEHFVIQPLISPEGDTYQLVPALDGSLFKYSERQRLLEPLPLNADMLLQVGALRFDFLASFFSKEM